MKTASIALIILAVLFLTIGCTQQEYQQKSELTREETVTIQGFEFIPSTLTVKEGKTVTWTNQDSAQHVVNSGLFESGILGEGDSFEFRFEKKGKYEYICKLHPSMTGKIIVE